MKQFLILISILSLFVLCEAQVPEHPNVILIMTDDQGSSALVFGNVSLNEMDCDIIPFYSVDNRRILPFWVSIERTDK